MTVYCNECDGEWSLFADEEDHDAQGGDDITAHELRDAELVFSLDGWRGHYLARDFCESAAVLVRVTDEYVTDVLLPDTQNDLLINGKPITITDAMMDKLKNSTYADLHEYDPNLASACDMYDKQFTSGVKVLLAGGELIDPEDIGQYVQDGASAIEQLLSDQGYVIEWNDGVTVHSVGDVVRDGGNPFARGLAEVPDAMGYGVFAIMDDGGVLCETCVCDITNPVQDAHDGDAKHRHGYSGWGVVAFDHTGNCDMDDVTCDHCAKVIFKGAVLLTLWGGWSYAHGEAEPFDDVRDAINQWVDRWLSNGARSIGGVFYPCWGDCAEDDIVLYSEAAADGLTRAQVIAVGNEGAEMPFGWDF